MTCIVIVLGWDPAKPISDAVLGDSTPLADCRGPGCDRTEVEARSTTTEESTVGKKPDVFVSQFADRDALDAWLLKNNADLDDKDIYIIDPALEPLAPVAP